MNTVLVVLEHDRGAWVDANDQAMTAGRALAAQIGGSVQCALIGDEARELAFRAAEAGADVLHVCVDEILGDYGPEAYGQTIVALMSELDPVAVVGVGTDRGNEVMAQAAARGDLPFVANCVSITSAGGPWTVTRVQWGGSLLEDATLDAPTKLLTYALHAVAPEAADSPGAGDVREFLPGLDPTLARSVVAQREELEAGVTLATAPVVVGGGRGVGSAEGFDALEELAELLGGRVGCSRAVTNNGWRNHSDQVGQTGTRIAPELYIATGISGAIQHWVGAMASKRILAINTDPEANMVAKADYAVIADLHELVPAISAEIRRRG